MNPILYINGYQIDLVAGQTIAQTKQVNDIANLDNRQANFTNRFKGADTANNRRAFEYLAMVGNDSNVPYQRNTAFLYSSSGECFIYKGWANVTATNGGEYDIYIYDGAIDLYKAIENRSLADLELSELDHTKSLAAVIASWDAASPYRYILADYGGKLTYSTNIINIDYQVPSVNTKWLWDKLFAHHGFTYSGSVFSTEEFIEHWMTFPKGVFTTIPDEERLSSSDYQFNEEVYGGGWSGISPGRKSRYLETAAPTLTPPTVVINDRHTQVNETGLYRVQLSGKIRIKQDLGITIQEVPAMMCFAKNSQSKLFSKDIIVYTQLGMVGSTSGDMVSYSFNFLINLDELETICFFLRGQFNIDDVNLSESSLTISKVVSVQVSFQNALAEFGQKEFLTEMLIKFGLTPYKDKYSNNIEFLTLQERLQTASIEDWSDKFVTVESEAYAHGNYAQKNIFAHNYNDKESLYYDGAILINNVNLQDSKTVIKSKIYSPAREPVQFLGRATNTYKLWEKEVNEDSAEPIKYKSLDKRFYFLRSKTIDFGSAKDIGSEILEETDTITSAPVESFFRMKWSDVVTDYYPQMQSILDKSLVQVIRLWLNDRDVVNLDLRKLYYIEQTASYYILNKVMNYIPGKSVRAEMIRVKLSRTIDAPPEEPEEPQPAPYCCTWEAYNLDNIKMAIEGEIDFTNILAGRTINTFSSSGVVTQYIIGGTLVSCSIPMDFTSTKASFNTDSLPVVTNKVLTSITVDVSVLCTNATGFEILETYSGAEVPGVQLTAEFNNCMI